MAKVFNIHINDGKGFESLNQRPSDTFDDILTKTFHDLVNDGVVWVVGPHDRFPDLQGRDWENIVPRMVMNANEFYMYSGAEKDLTSEDGRRHRREMARWERLEIWSKRVVSPTSGKQGWKVWTVDPEDYTDPRLEEWYDRPY